ncbi:hypothetical protein G7K_5423-t1 [Saitoella complicata NRRL Y-17804]|uniref:L-dopachrome isomerase n=1 Tax=Saitoella complicata (strain BCRC 22490 / CBS 7301 / JCM 7358 / NBRC 10748 / NRRL Y-17804) TaxID=698492 RepID=A0A0E9NPG5_SAICN|nr:hypothetical protein G7K_5423-t1 [Saitoella complicata NRRL Y-17804]
MPVVDLTVNFRISESAHLGRDLIKDLHAFSVETLKKPSKYMCVKINEHALMAFDGTFDPAFNLHITCLGVDVQQNKEIIAAYTKFLSEKFGLPGDRGYVRVVDPGRENIGPGFEEDARRYRHRECENQDTRNIM